MNWLAGVDEAGLGPILGPLVVGGVAMAGPAGVDPWRALRTTVCRHKAEKDKIRVADSKKVNQGPHGLLRLEQTVLTFLGAMQGAPPATVADLLSGLGVDVAPLRQCPWYRDLSQPLPLRDAADTLELRAHNLARSMARRDLRVGHLVAAVIDAKEFNDLIAETDNKSRTHFAAYSRVLGTLLDVLPAGAHLVADRCGGITHYVPALRRGLGRVRLRTVEESAGQSRYEIGADADPVRVTFAVQGEDRSFPTALASCVAKYVRELLMHLLNRWFQERVPDLAPTAGYYSDGHRFVRAIQPVLAHGEFPEELLIRCR